MFRLLISYRNSASRSQTRKRTQSTVVCVTAGNKEQDVDHSTVDKAVDYILAQPDGMHEKLHTTPRNKAN